MRIMRRMGGMGSNGNDDNYPQELKCAYSTGEEA